MNVDPTAKETTTGAVADEAAKAAAAAADKLAADKLADEEAARAAEEAGKAAEGSTTEAPADEAGRVAEDEATQKTAKEAGEGSSGRTDGPEAAVAPGATPTTDPSAVETAATPDSPPKSRYIRVGEDVYVSLPWTAGSSTPTEEGVADEEILVAAGLQLVSEPSISSSTSEEEQLLQKLLNLHRARREKLASREALLEKAETEMQRRAEILADVRARSLNALEVKRAQLAEERQALLLLKQEIEQKQEETAKELYARAGDLSQRKVDLDAHEEELAEREKKLAETLQRKDEEVARLVAERTQSQAEKHKAEIEALAQEYAGKLTEATSAAAAAEATRKETERKMAKLETDLKANGDRLSTLESERAKVTHTLAEMQVTIAKKNDLLAAANDSIEDLKLKLTTLKESLDNAVKREKLLATELQKEKSLLQDAVATHRKLRENVGIFTDRLASAAVDIDKELTAMGVLDFGYPADESTQTSVKLALFFDGVVEALQQLQDNQRAQLANESRKLCRGVLQRLLVKIAYRNPGVDFSNIFKKLPKEYDPAPLEALVAPILEKVDNIPRVEGEHHD
jgi:hypothetical protein